MTKHLGVIALFFLFVVQLSAFDIPVLRGYVNDYADMISSSAQQEITEKLHSLEESDSTQIYFLTIPSLEGQDIESYSIKVAETWKAGQKGMDNGIIFIVAKNDRKMRIEVGYGLEGNVTDLLAGRIIDNEAAPYFKSGDYDGGFIAVADSLIAAVKGEYQNTHTNSTARKASGSAGEKWLGLVIALLIVIKLISLVSKPVGAVAGFIIGGAASIIVGGFNPFLMLIGGLIGAGFAFIPLSLLFLIMSAGNGRGSSGSGGGFGGFSGGGGGGFGGGGASGGW